MRVSSFLGRHKNWRTRRTRLRLIRDGNAVRLSLNNTRHHPTQVSTLPLCPEVHEKRPVKNHCARVQIISCLVLEGEATRVYVRARVLHG